MASEETPLLGELQVSAIAKHEAIYLRFTPSQKRVILILASLSGLIPLFVSGTFVPSIPQIARDLNSTGTIISLAVSLSVGSNALGTLLWATYSGFYGRKPVYVVSLIFQCIGSLGVSLSRSVPELLAFRIFQAFGASSGLSVGMGVIADIYKLEERGTASGTFFGAVLLGPALAPLAGGITSHYFSWRIMQASLFVYALIMLAMTLLFLPETCHPGTRGVDKLQAEGGKAKFVLLNPFRCLGLLRSPNIVLVAIAGGLVLLTDYVLLVPIAYTLGTKYNISNEAMIGACFIPAGLGNILGARIAGRISDHLVIKWRKQRGGVWVPEDRLRGTLSGALLLTPLPLLLFGIASTYIDGPLGLTLCLISLFVHGFGIDIVLGPSAAYNVDVLHSRSAEVAAANMSTRGMMISLSTTGLLPLIGMIGVLPTNAIGAGLSVIGFCLLWSVIRYGDRMRAWVDVGYSTALNN